MILGKYDHTMIEFKALFLLRPLHKRFVSNVLIFLRQVSMISNFKLGLRGKSALILGALISFALIATNLANYWQSRSFAENEVMELEQSKSSVFKREIEISLRNHNQNLLSLHDLPPISAIIRARANNGIDPQSGDTIQEWRQRLTVIFSAFLVSHPEYLQIRYIDVVGNELVRIERARSDEILVIVGDKLQSKSDSIYVKETVKLKAGETYYSNVTLSREDGVIQVPLLPVLRMATPVFDTDGQVTSLIVLNLSTEQLFEAVKSEASGVRRELVNEKGYYIKHADASKTFGFERGFDYRLQTVEPTMADISLRHNQFIRHHKKHKEIDGFQKIFFSPRDHSRYWLLTHYIPEEIVFSGINTTFKRMLIGSILIGVLSLLIIVWFISRNILMPVVTMAKTYECFKAGDLTNRLDTATVSDEFLTLYEGINEFAETQQQATNKLKNEVAAQTKRLSAVINNIVDGIITISERGIIESFNPSASKIFGYGETEVIGQNVKILMPEPYHSHHDGYLDHYIKTGEKRVIGTGREVLGQRKDGSTFPMDLEVNDMTIDNAKHFVGIVRDISERKQAEAEQKRLQAQLLQAQKMESIGQLTGGIAHDFNNMLASIMGYTDLARVELTQYDNEKITGYLNRAYKSSERARDLVKQMLAFSRGSDVDLQPLNLSTIIDESLTMLNSVFPSSIVIERQLNDENLVIMADPVQLHQLIMNLCINARDAMQGKGHITIESKRVNKLVSKCGSCHKKVSGDYIELSVCDNGPGIKLEYIERIFDPFFTSKKMSSVKGAGMGLAVVHGIMHSHDGHIILNTEVGKGSTFTLLFPVTEKYNSVISESSYTPVLPNKTLNGHILIVDDEPVVGALIGELLEGRGCRVTVETDSQSALLKFKENPHDFDLLVTDQTMPGMTGGELAQAVLTVRPELPVILCTGYSDYMDENKARLLGIRGYVSKPLDINKFLELLESLLRV